MNGNDVEAHSNDHHDTTMKTLKTIEGVPGNWTITDSHLSPDNERMIYSSIVGIHSHQSSCSQLIPFPRTPSFT